MSVRVLWVDDEPNLLESAQRLLRRRYEIDTVESGPQGIGRLMKDGGYDIIVSDMRMPVMTGIQFLAQARQLAPDAVRIMLTGYADQQTAIDAVNEGAVFRFLTKPSPPEKLLQALQAAEEQRRLLTLERDLLQQTLTGAVKVLLEVLALTQPIAFGRAHRLRTIARMLAERLQAGDPWKVEVGAMLSQIGCITVPEATLTRILERREVSPQDLEMYDNHPRVGADLIARIPRLEDVSAIIALQHAHFDGGKKLPADECGENLPLGARILKVALDYDSLVAQGMEHDSAVVRLRARPGWYDPGVLAALNAMPDVVAAQVDPTILVSLDKLEAGMILAEDIVADSGATIVARGQEINLPLVIRLLNFSRSISPDRRFRVYPKQEETLLGATGS